VYAEARAHEIGVHTAEIHRTVLGPRDVGHRAEVTILNVDGEERGWAG
jgi:hypothetical protein